MSREIKFRAFADFIEFQVMLEDVSIHSASGMVGLNLGAFYKALNSTDWEVSDDLFRNKNTGETFDIDSVGVYDSGEDYYFFEGTKIMQYTGLKDKNGVEIYEGDIIETIGSEGLIHHKIIFDDGGFCHENIKYPSMKGKLRQDWVSRFYVIGNIYANPELLKQ
jgi:uncharacterized phage protein (TIGR01671 family)